MFESRKTDIGTIGIAVEGGEVVAVTFEGKKAPRSKGAETARSKDRALVTKAFRQLDEYLAGKRKTFDLPLKVQGTEFMQGVYRELCRIPYGKTASYKEVATSVGRPKAVRAVGMANNRNNIPIFIPCHRVIGSDGKLVGYAGGVELKAKLLELEGGTGKS